MTQKKPVKLVLIYCNYFFRANIFHVPLATVKLAIGEGSFLDFRVDFHKIIVLRSSVCRTILIRHALESPEPGASDDGSNYIFRHFRADMAAFEVAG